MKNTKTVVLAYSGGLDTTYCLVRLREAGYAVHALAVDTGGFDAAELAELERRAQAAGAAKFVSVDAKDELFNGFLRFLIFANALRGGVYPLCASVERVVQAQCVARYAVAVGAAAIAHGSTGAGNDQVRFDTTFRILAPGMEILTPIRQEAPSREEETAFLGAHGIHIPPKTGRYSINRGLWGVTIGGGETHRSAGVLPEDAYLLTAPPEKRPPTPQTVRIGFEQGVPKSLDGEVFSGPALIERLTALAARHGVGRGMHTGETILGIKGRVAFEAPAAVTLISAHRELEKLVLSRSQLFWKNILGDLYGSMLHEARYFDPLMRDLEAFLISSQQRVTGWVSVRLFQGQATVEGIESPYSLLDGTPAVYGEKSSLWTGEEAAAFCKLYGLADALHYRHEAVRCR